MHTMLEVAGTTSGKPLASQGGRPSLAELSTQDTDVLLASLYRSLPVLDGEPEVEKGFNSSI
ncbi:hypothetical protein OG500_21940 [Kitasatospora sp. NBC_01250]|uniref:hypothetical protein n=1 Tax=unclassified Kitasatospora TaxID=2633591 RepID=UPI002E10D1B5|nr:MULTISPECIES: hypothetical protein [unclassified Kitasatospora]WSJ68712.1 hypothetical protein OG294_22785 [Kitasatospora sp. NBC_01302]